MAKAEKKGVNIVFPVDFVIADKFSKDANVSVGEHAAGYRHQLIKSVGPTADTHKRMHCGNHDAKLYSKPRYS